MSNDKFDPESVDAILARILQRLDSLEKNSVERLNLLEAYVRDLDRFKYWMLGVAAVSGIVGAKITSFFKN